MHLDARTYLDGGAGGQFAWWESSSQSTFVMHANLRWKFMVIKCQIPAMTLPSGGFVGVSISMTQNSAPSGFNEAPTVEATNLVTGPGSTKSPIVWWQEIGTSSTHPSSGFNQAGKSEWKATHKTFNQGLTSKQNNTNNSGSLWGTGYSLHNVKIHRIYGVNTTLNAFNLYFRIGLPNQGSVDIQQIKVQFKYISQTNVATDVTGTNATQTFNYLN